MAGRAGELVRPWDRWLETKLDWWALAILLIGLVIRLRLADLTYLGLDEAYHSRLSTPWFPALWKTAHEPTHPPLLLFITHFVRGISLSEPVLRMVPVVSGIVFPWFIYRWMGLVWNRTAGLVALVILVFAPMLAQLSSVLRQYTLGLLFLSIAMYLLELSIRKGSTKHMWGFAFALWLAIISAFPTAFFCGALGVYVLLRVREPSFTRSSIYVWVFSQVLALATYAHFLFNQILKIRENHQKLVHDQQAYFAGMFPVEGTDPIAFITGGALQQFNLTFQREPMPQWGALLFVLGLCLVIWHGRRNGWGRSLSLATVMVAPLVITCAASFTKTYPWGNSRQNAFLVVCVAIGVGIAVDFLLRRRTALILLAVLFIVPDWITDMYALNQTRSEDVRSRANWGAMMDFLHEEAPDARLLIEGNLGIILCHYLAGDDWPIGWARGETRSHGFRWFGGPGYWEDFDTVWEWLARYQEEFEIPDDEIIYVLDADVECNLCPIVDEMENVPFAAGEIQRYGQTGILIPVRAGYRPPAEEAPPEAETDAGEAAADKVSSAS